MTKKKETNIKKLCNYPDSNPGYMGSKFTEVSTTLRRPMELTDKNNQPLQLCAARKVFSILVTVHLYTVMTEVCRWLTNAKPRKTDIRATDQ